MYGDTHDHPHTAGDGDGDALVSRLRLIEDQPLEARAPAFAQVHDELQAALGAGDSSHGG